MPLCGSLPVKQFPRVVIIAQASLLHETREIQWHQHSSLCIHRPHTDRFQAPPPIPSSDRFQAAFRRTPPQESTARHDRELARIPYDHRPFPAPPPIPSSDRFQAAYRRSPPNESTAGRTYKDRDEDNDILVPEVSVSRGTAPYRGMSTFLKRTSKVVGHLLGAGADKPADEIETPRSSPDGRPQQSPGASRPKSSYGIPVTCIDDADVDNVRRS